MNVWDKIEALAALSDLSVVYRPDSPPAVRWYVQQAVEVKDGSILRGEYGEGGTPEEAIEDHWRRLVDDLPASRYLVINVDVSMSRAAVRWNGFMWKPVREEEKM